MVTSALPAMTPLEGQVALVTGAGQGLGAAIARTLAAGGARVVVADLRGPGCEQVAGEIEAAGGQALPLQLDVADAGSATAAVEHAVQAFGALDILVNNAGIDVTKPVDELTFAEWDRVIATNLRGPFVMSKCALPVLREGDRGRGGQIVNVASTAARRAWPNASAYHASKWGLLGLSHALHAEFRPHGVRVSALIAGGMRTPFLLDRFEGIDPGKLQDPANVAVAVRFLLTMPRESVIPEMMVLPLMETSWP
ncbi:SDR family oxidoreductase [Caldimonas thermodepolymerans]|uniref:NADP-dependent 3-hydroxy acid dehydrogenase YdfG n=2 Tax=Caldimonas thermodepolymerans TaxID=215580 RepID=A0AA46DDJ6_9BURK|nr:SDR family oxidoreductase [Caldimonas thermodepolymerans]TCP06778.1 NADP-dependent 3-hydroxy acid dehydrogenase YdfG [Caldimonas thermodepolymerans]UZG49173.1 SDR family oxidoreductase [Caldimonas thermodepolymerans]